LNGCYSSDEISRRGSTFVQVFKIVLKDGRTIDFTEDKSGYGYLRKNEVVQFNDDGEIKTFPLDNIDKIYTEKFDLPKTVFTSIGITVSLFSTLLMLFAMSFHNGVGG